MESPFLEKFKSQPGTILGCLLKPIQPEQGGRLDNLNYQFILKNNILV